MPEEKDPVATPASRDKEDVGPAKVPSALDEAKAAMEDVAAPQATASEAEEEDRADELDAARPEAIARRVAALGEEDENEKLARAEEAKLAARRKEQKRGKKGGLEAAASKRLAKIGANAPVKRSVATAVDAEPVIDRAAQLADWAKKNQSLVSAVAVVAVLVAGGFGFYTYSQHKKETQASVALAKALADERGRVGDPDKEEEPNQPHDPRPVFKTTDDRREAALRDYRDVEAKFAGTGAAILARLSEGAILLDKRDVQAATAAFTEVEGSLLAKADAEVRGRALEGLGFAYELKADSLAGDPKGAAQDEALKSFRQLENLDVDGFKELGMYHQARVYEAKGDKPKAIELLKSLNERIHKPEDKTHPFAYLQQVADDRLRALDPSALPPKAPPQPMGGAADAAMRRRIMEAMSKGQGGK